MVCPRRFTRCDWYAIFPKRAPLAHNSGGAFWLPQPETLVNDWAFLRVQLSAVTMLFRQLGFGCGRQKAPQCPHQCPHLDDPIGPTIWPPSARSKNGRGGVYGYSKLSTNDRSSLTSVRSLFWSCDARRKGSNCKTTQSYSCSLGTVYM